MYCPKTFLIFVTDEINPNCKEMFSVAFFCCLLYITEKKVIILSSNMRKTRAFIEELSIKVLG